MKNIRNITMSSSISFLIITLLIQQPINCDVGKAWVITDFHFNPGYSVDGDRTNLCRVSPPVPAPSVSSATQTPTTSSLSNSTTDSTKLGIFGDYECDPPLSLIKSAISNMKKINPNPDFILWTGDSLPHLDDKDLSIELVKDILKNMTQLLLEEFPQTTLIPVLGNNDAFPRQHFPVTITNFYENILNNYGWGRLLPYNVGKKFVKGGYYSWLVRPGLRIIVLNTNLFSHKNPLIDPENFHDLDQMKWLETVLKESQTKNQHAILVGHMPPGLFPSQKNFTTFYEKYNSEYLKLVAEYSSTIGAHIYAHQHRDSFQIYRDENGTAVGTGFLSPSVTPYNLKFPGGGPNNPSFRMLHYDREYAYLHDYDQYFMNLTSSNEDKNATWNLEYSATKTYGLEDLKPASMQRLLDRFNETESTNFTKFLEYYTVSQPLEFKCDEKCKMELICAIGYVDYNQSKTCYKRESDAISSSTSAPVPSPTTPMIVATTSVPADVKPTKKNDPKPHIIFPDNDKPSSPFEDSTVKYNHYVVGALATTVVLILLIVALICIMNPKYCINPRYLFRGGAAGQGYTQVGAV